MSFAGLRSAFFLGSALIASGCRILTSCTYEERSIKASGSEILDGHELASAEIAVTAVRGTQEWTALQYVIRGQTLMGHVTAIELAGVRSGIGVSVKIPVFAPTSASLSAGGLTQLEGEPTPDLDGVYEVLASNGARVEISTDLSPFNRVSVLLRKSEQADWSRPHNCF
jgi:hypothetical protein